MMPPSKDYFRSNMDTAWHSAGTCKMARQRKAAVLQTRTWMSMGLPA